MSFVDAPKLSPLAQAAVDGFRREFAAERKEREDFDRVQLDLYGYLPLQGERDEVERDRQARDLEKIERRAAEREQEYQQGELRDAASRDRGWQRSASGVEYYVEDTGAEPNPRSDRAYAEPRVTDYVEGLNESIGPVQVGYVNEEDARLIREAHRDRPTWTPYGELVINTPIKDESVPGEGEVTRVNTAQTPDATPLRVTKEDK